MSIEGIIKRSRDNFKDRDFKFIRSFNCPFKCDICNRYGDNGYTLQDKNEKEIYIGATCFKKNFSIRINNAYDSNTSF